MWRFADIGGGKPWRALGASGLGVVAALCAAAPALGGSGAANDPIRDVTLRFSATSLNIGASSADINIAADAGRQIVIRLIGPARLVKSVRFTEAADVLKIEDGTLALGGLSTGRVQVEAHGPGARAEVTIGNKTVTAQGERIDLSAGQKKLRLEIRMPRGAKLTLRDASGNVRLAGLAGAQKIRLSGNAAFEGSGMSGELDLNATGNSAVELHQADFREIRAAASENASIEFSGRAQSAHLRASENADIEITGSVTIASKRVSDNATIDFK